MKDTRFIDVVHRPPGYLPECRAGECVLVRCHLAQRERMMLTPPKTKHLPFASAAKAHVSVDPPPPPQNDIFHSEYSSRIRASESVASNIK